MYNIFGTFSWALFIITVLQATDGGGAGFTQMALAARHTGLLGTEQFKLQLQNKPPYRALSILCKQKWTGSLVEISQLP